MTLKQQTCIS